VFGLLFLLAIGLASLGSGGGEPANSPPERAEQDEGVEGGGNDPEANQPLEGEKAQGANGQAAQNADATASPAASASAAGETKTAIVKVAGTPGTRSVNGTTPSQYNVKFSPDPWEMDSIYVDFYKEMDANANYPPGTLAVQIVVDGKVVQQSSSAARDAYVSLSWTPSE
jgi:hypothetical protein